jgi:hypothetical protein
VPGRRQNQLVVVPLKYCFSIPFFVEFIREMINELGEDCRIDIIVFRGSEPAMPQLFSHPSINIFEVAGFGKLRYINFWLVLLSLLFRRKYIASYLISQFSMLLVPIIPNFRCGKIVYLNDEIWELPKHASYIQKTVKLMEKYACRRASAIVTQDKFRGRLVKFVNGNPQTPFVYIPNSRKNTPGERRIIAKKLGISDETTVLLWSGSVSLGDGCLDLVRLIVKGRKNVSLLLHFRSKALDKYKAKVLEYVDNNKIFYIDTEFDYDNLDQLYMSADIGICPYPNRGVNARSIYHASGKINSFLGCGVPIITSDFHGLRWISKNGLGVCLEKFPNGIHDAINVINSEPKVFNSKALGFYLAHLDASKKWRALINDINESV